MKSVGKFLKWDFNNILFYTKTTKKAIFQIFICENKGLLDSINTLLAGLYKNNLLNNDIKLLYTFLNYKFYCSLLDISFSLFFWFKMNFGLFFK